MMERRYVTWKIFTMNTRPHRKTLKFFYFLMIIYLLTLSLSLYFFLPNIDSDIPSYLLHISEFGVVTLPTLLKQFVVLQLKSSL